MPRTALPLAPLFALALLLVQAASPPATLATEGTEHHTAHYDLYVESPLDPSETGDLLEALHRELSRFFGTAPKGPLRVEIYADQERFRAALRRDRQPYQSGGGLYGPTSGKVWLAIQPSEAYTRQLILHEATHQFHFPVATSNRFPSAAWYTEGLAEFMGMANWDGRRLRVGVIPAITLEDYPARARAVFDAIDWDVAGALEGHVAVGQAGGWALVHFLAHDDAQRFRDLGRRLERRDDPPRALREVYGEIGPGFVSRFRRWLRRHRQPWDWRWNSWQERGGWIEGDSDRVAVSTLKETPRRLDVELRPVSGYFKGGLVFGYRSAEDFYMMSLRDDRTVRLLRRRLGSWLALDQTRIGQPAVPDTLAVEQHPGGVHLWVNGQVIAVVDALGKVGLMVDGCRARFRPTIDRESGALARAGSAHGAG